MQRFLHPRGRASGFGEADLATRKRALTEEFPTSGLERGALAEPVRTPADVAEATERGSVVKGQCSFSRAAASLGAFDSFSRRAHVSRGFAPRSVRGHGAKSYAWGSFAPAVPPGFSLCWGEVGEAAVALRSRHAWPLRGSYVSTAVLPRRSPCFRVLRFAERESNSSKKPSCQR